MMNTLLSSVCVTLAILMCSAVKTDSTMIVKAPHGDAAADDDDEPIIMHVLMDKNISKTNHPAVVVVSYKHTSQDGICKVSLSANGVWKIEMHIQGSIGIGTDKMIT